MATLPALSNVASSISSGNFASGLATNTGGLSSISTSLSGAAPSITSGITGGVSGSLGGVLSGATSGGTLSSLASGNLSAAGSSFAAGIESSGVDLKTGKSAALEESVKSGSLKSTMDSVKGISGSAFSSISDSLKPLKGGVPQNLTSINLKNKLEQIAEDTKTAAAPAASELTNGLTKGGVNVKTGEIPAVTAAVASGGVGAGASALAGAMSGVPGMSGMVNANPAAMASGLTNLPGGQSAASSLINSTTGATSGISDTLGGLNSITKNASSAALNQISSSTAGSSSVSSLLTGGALTGAGASLSGSLTNPGGTLSSLTGGLPNASSITGSLPSVDNLTKGLQAGKQPLSSLATSGLSTAGAASLTASINSLSTSGPSPIKMPTVAEKTIDRSEVSSQVTSLLGDKKIPAPNYTATPPVPSSRAADIKAARLEYITMQQEYDKEVAIRAEAIKKEADAYGELKKTLPEGDPQRTAARDLGRQNAKEFQDWNTAQKAKLEAKRQEVNQLQQSEGQAIFNQTSADARANT